MLADVLELCTKALTHSTIHTTEASPSAVECRRPSFFPVTVVVAGMAEVGIRLARVLLNGDTLVIILGLLVTVEVMPDEPEDGCIVLVEAKPGLLEPLPIVLVEVIPGEVDERDVPVDVDPGDDVELIRVPGVLEADRMLDLTADAAILATIGAEVL